MPSYSDRPKPEPHRRVVPRWVRVPRIRITARGVLLFLLLIGLGIFLARDEIWPPSDEERIRELFEDVVEAMVDEDWEDLWDLAAKKGVRRDVEAQLRAIRELDPDDESWAGLEREFGLNREEILEEDDEALYVAAQEYRIRQAPDQWRILKAALDGLEIHAIRYGWPGANVDCGKIDGFSISFDFTREDGEWRFAAASAVRMRFRTLDRKIAAALPKGRVPPGDIELVIEIGPDGVDKASRRRLGSFLNALLEGEGPDTVVVIDAWPEVPFQQVMDVFDELRLKGVERICFAASGLRDEARFSLRINGVDLSRMDEDPDFRDPSAMEAALRIIGLGN